MEELNQFQLIGRQFSQQKKFLKALEFCERSIDINSDIPELQEKKGWALLDSQDFSDAHYWVKIAIELNPSLKNAWYTKGEIPATRGKNSEDPGLCNSDPGPDPAPASPWYDQGNVHDPRKKYHDTLTSFDNALKNNPASAQFWNNNGKVLNDIGRFDEAVVHFNRAIELDPLYGEPWDNKGISLEKTGHLQEAIECYNQALKLNANNYFTLTNKASALIKLGKYLEALDLVNLALEKEPEGAIAWNTKGVIFTHLKRNREALSCFDKAVSLNPNYYTAWCNKSYCIDDLDLVPAKRTSNDSVLAEDHLVFISYANPEDRDRAMKICDSLELQGIKCWFAFRDLKSATYWSSESVNALKNSKFCLLVFSEAANSAEGVFHELRIANITRIPIIPCRIEDVEPSEYLMYHLARRQYYDIFKGDQGAHMKNLAEIIKKELRQ
jgi:tetratricopeptide (TPR) repeat protein